MFAGVGHLGGGIMVGAAERGACVAASMVALLHQWQGNLHTACCSQKLVLFHRMFNSMQCLWQWLGAKIAGE